MSAAYHISQARMLAAALQDQAAVEVLLPTRKANTLVTSLRVLREELDQAAAALTARRPLQVPGGALPVSRCFHWLDANAQGAPVLAAVDGLQRAYQELTRAEAAGLVHAWLRAREVETMVNHHFARCVIGVCVAQAVCGERSCCSASGRNPGKRLARCCSVSCAQRFPRSSQSP